MRTFLYLATVCLALGGCKGGLGELGDERFAYYCAEPGDPYCDFETYEDDCYNHCNSPFEEFNTNKIPAAVALGSRFRILIDSGKYNESAPTTSSPGILEWDGTSFIARQTGEVAVLAWEDESVVDFYYVTISAPTEVRIDRVDADGEQDKNISAFILSAGEETWLRARIYDVNAEPLYGALPCAWTVGDATLIAFETSTDDNLVVLSADASALGSATVQVTLGDLTAAVSVTVVESPLYARGGTP